MRNPAALAIEDQLVAIPAGSESLYGRLTVPLESSGLILFAQGSSGFHNPRSRYLDRYVERLLNESNLATLLVDLLTVEEQEIDLRTKRLRLNIALLAERLIGVADWITQYPDTKGLRIGYFGTDTGIAAALEAAAVRSDQVGAITSRGGRPDLAGAALVRVCAPTLLIVGGNDLEAVKPNREAFKQLKCEKQFALVPGATRFFEEPVALDEVAALARRWYYRHLVG
ncbi:dienelactone hydrolase family protein [Bradyrhizobium australafricanum]|uniref:dienelactone hydrolase family protein n=1 Tax=Bradyrhizobium australafricanum TaxID=2821406 RepID=UPI001CE37CCA|nr:alpha/beta hydrolase [Bradyrhizobium australafricanum]MCA6100715.1 alpha/beta hydrolase [Bradyrhizobium australafricanum]